MAIFNKAGEGVVNQLSIDEADVLIDPYTQNPIYQFEPKFLLIEDDLSKVSTGIGVGLSVDTSFNFIISNRLGEVLDEDQELQNDNFFNGVEVDILNKNGGLVFDNFAQGLINSIEFTKSDNISKFGSFQKDYGVGVKIFDKTNVGNHVSQYYVYRNPLYVSGVSVVDKNGTYNNPQPIGYQTYVPTLIQGEFENAIPVGSNYFHIPSYKLTIDDTNVELKLKIVFAYQKQEALKVTWDDSTESNPFYYNNGTFVGPGVTVTNTSTNDLIFRNIGLTNLNGKTYEFTINHNYTAPDPKNYIISIKIDDIDLTAFQEIYSFQAFMPNGFSDPIGGTSNGILLSKETVSGDINFQVNFANNTEYTSYDKVSVYGRQNNSSVEINETYFIKDISILGTNSQIINFTISDSEIKPTTNYWFYLVPHSESATGMPWKIGPYQVERAIVDDRADVGGKSFTTNGLRSFAYSEIREGDLQGFDVSIIDKIPFGSGILSCEYFCSIQSDNADTCSSKLILTNNFENTDPDKWSYHLSQYAISDKSFVDYFIEEGDEDLILKCQMNENVGYEDPSAIFVVHKNQLNKIITPPTPP